MARNVPVSIRFFSHIVPALAVAFLFCGNPLEAETVDFTDRADLESAVSDNGTVTLSWKKPDSLIIELQQSSSEDFTETTTRYRGTDPASVITGLPEGTHYFRIADASTSEWSAPLAMKVEFFPRWKLWLILSIGAGVVLATIGTIVVAHFITKNEEDAA
ncbi:MAG: fibronectin type III domain-containing protein [Luteolibacter sp.]